MRPHAVVSCWSRFLPLTLPIGPLCNERLCSLRVVSGPALVCCILQCCGAWWFERRRAPFVLEKLNFDFGSVRLRLPAHACWPKWSSSTLFASDKVGVIQFLYAALPTTAFHINHNHSYALIYLFPIQIFHTPFFYISHLCHLFLNISRYISI